MVFGQNTKISRHPLIPFTAHSLGKYILEDGVGILEILEIEVRS